MYVEGIEHLPHDYDGAPVQRLFNPDLEPFRPSLRMPAESAAFAHLDDTDAPFNPADSLTRPSPPIYVVQDNVPTDISAMRTYIDGGKTEAPDTEEVTAAACDAGEFSPSKVNPH